MTGSFRHEDLVEEVFQALEVLGLAEEDPDQITRELVAKKFREKILASHSDHARSEDDLKQRHEASIKINQAKELLFSLAQDGDFSFISECFQPARFEDVIIPSDDDYTHKDLLDVVAKLVRIPDIEWEVKYRFGMQRFPRSIIRVFDDGSLEYTFPSFLRSLEKERFSSSSPNFLQIVETIATLPPERVLHLRKPAEFNKPNTKNFVWVVWSLKGYNSLQINRVR